MVLISPKSFPYGGKTNWLRMYDISCSIFTVFHGIGVAIMGQCQDSFFDWIHIIVAGITASIMSYMRGANELGLGAMQSLKVDKTSL